MAVNLAKEVVGDLDDCKVLVIGAGEVGRLVARAARERGASQIVVYSRSHKKALALAEALGCASVASGNLTEELTNADIAISCTAAPHTVLRLDQVERVMCVRPDRPLVIIDIAVPRDVAPEVKQLDNVFLYNIDDLTQISDLNRRQREGEIRKAEEIIAAEVANFASWWQAFEVRPIVSALMGKAERVRRLQLNRTLKKLRPLSDEERYSLEMMTKSIVAKILQDPILYLKTNANASGDYAEMINELFQLDREKQG